MKYRSLKKEKDFQRVFQKGKKINCPELTLIFLPRQNDPINYVAIITSKANFRKATQRNLIKRRLRAILRQINLAKNGLDIIIIAKTPLLTKKFEDLKIVVESIFQKAKLNDIEFKQ
ncbi:MAG TPA: ribonuclease P protein component [Candidatus Paceibacterota bacterium]|nr:ribonuclease P protein component [Candidatus Paceibacterota bacterium]